jgi:hypothetical protein
VAISRADIYTLILDVTQTRFGAMLPAATFDTARALSGPVSYGFDIATLSDLIDDEVQHLRAAPLLAPFAQFVIVEKAMKITTLLAGSLNDLLSYMFDRICANLATHVVLVP